MSIPCTYFLSLRWAISHKLVIRPNHIGSWWAVGSPNTNISHMLKGPIRSAYYTIYMYIYFYYLLYSLTLHTLHSLAHTVTKKTVEPLFHRQIARSGRSCKCNYSWHTLAVHHSYPPKQQQRQQQYRDVYQKNGDRKCCRLSAHQFSAKDYCNNLSWITHRNVYCEATWYFTLSHTHLNFDIIVMQFYKNFIDHIALL